MAIKVIFVRWVVSNGPVLPFRLSLLHHHQGRL